MKKSIPYAALRWLSAALVLVLILGHTLKNRVSPADFSSVEASVAPTVLCDAMKKADAQLLKRLYGLNPSDYEGCVLYAPVSNIDARELLLVKLRDVSQQAAVVAAAEQRLRTQTNAFDGYGTDQYALLTGHSAIEAHGNYVMFVVSENEAAAKAAFLAAL